MNSSLKTAKNATLLRSNAVCIVRLLLSPWKKKEDENARVGDQPNYPLAWFSIMGSKSVL